MAEGSHIIFISTSLCTATTVAPPYLLYNATKGAIEQMTRVMSKDLASKGICVNAVAPGPTGTDLFYKGKSDQMLKAIAGFSPMGRIGKPEEIAEAIVWYVTSPVTLFSYSFRNVHPLRTIQFPDNLISIMRGP